MVFSFALQSSAHRFFLQKNATEEIPQKYLQMSKAGETSVPLSMPTPSSEFNGASTCMLQNISTSPVIKKKKRNSQKCTVCGQLRTKQFKAKNGKCHSKYPSHTSMLGTPPETMLRKEKEGMMKRMSLRARCPCTDSEINAFKNQ